jgi:hypothetical protein
MYPNLPCVIFRGYHLTSARGCQEGPDELDFLTKISTFCLSATWTSTQLHGPDKIMRKLRLDRLIAQTF